MFIGEELCSNYHHDGLTLTSLPYCVARVIIRIGMWDVMRLNHTDCKASHQTYNKLQMRLSTVISFPWIKTRFAEGAILVITNNHTLEETLTFEFRRRYEKFILSSQNTNQEVNVPLSPHSLLPQLHSSYPRYRQHSSFCQYVLTSYYLFSVSLWFVLFLLW